MDMGWIRELVKDVATLAAFAIVVITLWRAITVMKNVGKSVAGIEKRLLNMWFAAEKVGSARPRIISGVDCYETWDTSLVRGLMRGAKRNIRILQTWFPEGEGDIDLWKFENLHGLEIEIFMAHSQNPAILERVRFRRDFSNERSEEDLKAHIAKNVNACQKGLEDLFDKCRSKCGTFSASIWLYKMGMPFGPIYIIDDYAIFGIYPPHINSTAAPMIRLMITEGPGGLLEEAFETMKKTAEKVYESQLSSPNP